MFQVPSDELHPVMLDVDIEPGACLWSTFWALLGILHYFVKPWRKHQFSWEGILHFILLPLSGIVLSKILDIGLQRRKNYRGCKKKKPFVFVSYINKTSLKIKTDDLKIFTNLFKKINLLHVNRNNIFMKNNSIFQNKFAQKKGTILDFWKSFNSLQPFFLIHCLKYI